MISILAKHRTPVQPMAGDRRGRATMARQFDIRMSRVIMIGLDAASLDFIEAARASLPNFRRLLDLGVSHRFHPPSGDLFPASVWPSFYTASQPGDHGVYYP